MAGEHSRDLGQTGHAWDEAELLRPTEEERINYFRLCRIVLDDISENLRERLMFKLKQKNKSKLSKYTGEKNDVNYLELLLTNEKFLKKKMHPSQWRQLEQCRIESWDVSVLMEVSLYSSQLLFVHPTSYKVNIEHKHPFGLVAVSPKVHFNHFLDINDNLLVQIGADEIIRREIHSLSEKRIVLKQPVKYKHLNNITVHVCNEGWNAINDIAKIRNTNFAHCKNARISSCELNFMIDKLESCYKALNITQRRIDNMLAIKSEKYIDDATHTKLHYYRDKWISEIKQCIEMNLSVQHLQDKVGNIQFEVHNLYEIMEQIKHEESKLNDKVQSIQADVVKVDELVVETKTLVENVRDAQQKAEDRIIGNTEKELSKGLQKTNVQLKKLENTRDILYDIIATTKESVSQLSEHNSEKLHQTNIRLVKLEETEDKLCDLVASTKESISQLSKHNTNSKEELSQIRSQTEIAKDDIEHIRTQITDTKSDITKVLDEVAIIKKQQLEEISTKAVEIVISSKVKKIEHKFSELTRDLLTYLKHNNSNVTELKSCISCILKCTNIYVYSVWVKITKNIEDYEELDSLFTVLNMKIWDILDYNLLEFLIKCLGNIKLRRKMNEYIHDLKIFKKTTLVKDFINCRQSQPDDLVNYSEVEFKFDKDSLTLAELDTIFKTILQMCFPSLSIFCKWICLKDFQNGCFTVSGLFPDQLIFLLKHQIGVMDKVFVKYGVTEIVHKGTVLYDQYRSSFTGLGRCYSLPTNTFSMISCDRVITRIVRSSSTVNANLNKKKYWSAVDRTYHIEDFSVLNLFEDILQTPT